MLAVVICFIFYQNTNVLFIISDSTAYFRNNKYFLDSKKYNRLSEYWKYKDVIETLWKQNIYILIDKCNYNIVFNTESTRDCPFI